MPFPSRRSAGMVALACMASLAWGGRGRAENAPTAPTAAAGAPLPDIRLTPAFPALTFVRPVLLTHAGDGSGRLFVLEQPGRIRVFPNRADAAHAAVFLDLTDRVNDRGNEEGLLALAFHPRFQANGRLFIYYTAANPRRGVLSGFTVSGDDPTVVDPKSEQIILQVDQPYANHNGSTVLFGPDGHLYMSLGDGGAANDPHNHGQDMRSLLGKILRLDVDREADGKPYAIPADNPFIGRPDARPEIWASGLRNVWRMSFDRATGELWAGDVGQNAWEEVDLIVKGGNYGWNVREGMHEFTLRPRGQPPASGPFIDPVVEYPRNQGISITGGATYRGTAIPQLVGAYVYAEYAYGRIWALRHEHGTLTAHRQILTDKLQPGITSFGEDEQGELYVCVFDGVDRRGTPGRILRIVPR
jgi:glucose/arabinose dehydrogenase